MGEILPSCSIYIGRFQTNVLSTASMAVREFLDQWKWNMVTITVVRRSIRHTLSERHTGQLAQRGCSILVRPAGREWI